MNNIQKSPANISVLSNFSNAEQWTHCPEQIEFKFENKKNIFHTQIAQNDVSDQELGKKWTGGILSDFDL